MTTFYTAKNDHRWVTFMSLKTINSATILANLRFGLAQPRTRCHQVNFFMIGEFDELVIGTVRAIIGMQNSAELALAEAEVKYLSEATEYSQTMTDGLLEKEENLFLEIHSLAEDEGGE